MPRPLADRPTGHDFALSFAAKLLQRRTPVTVRQLAADNGCSAMTAHRMVRRIERYFPECVYSAVRHRDMGGSETIVFVRRGYKLKVSVKEPGQTFALRFAARLMVLPAPTRVEDLAREMKCSRATAYRVIRKIERFFPQVELLECTGKVHVRRAA